MEEKLLIISTNNETGISRFWPSVKLLAVYSNDTLYLVHVTHGWLRAPSICQNWPTGPVRKQMKSAIYTGCLLKNVLLRAYYLGID